MSQTCPYCRETVADGKLAECPACHTPHHYDCWVENGGCTVFGCEYTPADEPKMAVTVGEVGRSADSSGGSQATYLVQRQGQQFGPYPIELLQRYVAEQRISLTDFAWSQGMPSWVPVSQIIGNISIPMRAAQHPSLPRAYPQYQQAQPIIVEKPQNYLVSAIFVTLLCCLPLGIVSIIYASQVDSKFNAGDYAGARQASDNARTWYHAALIIGLLVIIITIAAK